MRSARADAQRPPTCATGASGRGSGRQGTRHPSAAIVFSGKAIRPRKHKIVELELKDVGLIVCKCAWHRRVPPAGMTGCELEDVLLDHYNEHRRRAGTRPKGNA